MQSTTTQKPAGAVAAGTTPQAQSPRPANPNPPIPPEFEAGPIMKLDESGALALLKNPQSTYFQKAIACKRLAVIGRKASIEPLAALLGDPQLAHYGRFGLEPNPDAAAGKALRAALPGLKGRLLVGVIHTLGVRKDLKAVEALGKLMYDADPEVAQAASASLGSIGGPQAARMLQEGLTRTSVPVLPVVARAALLCAETLPDRKQSRELYEQLTGNGMPRVVRQAAFRVLNNAARA